MRSCVLRSPQRETKASASRSRTYGSLTSALMPAADSRIPSRCSYPMYWRAAYVGDGELPASDAGELFGIHA